MSDSKQANNAIPFLKWVGGKSQLLEQFDDFFPVNPVQCYFEPFVGGGAVFFYLRGRNFANKYFISDANEELILTYQVVRDLPDELLTYLRKYKAKHHEVGKDFYYEMRAWDRSSGFHKRKKVTRAARLIYSNKTCFNGLWRVNSKGEFNVPMGRYKNPRIHDIERIQQASKALADVTIEKLDFEEAVSAASTGDFVYLDPPYVPLNGTSNFTSYYSDGFNHSKQQQLANLFLDLHNRGCQVMLSNSDTAIVHEMYKDLGIKKLRIEKVHASRRINSNSKKRGEITEVVVMNY